MYLPTQICLNLVRRYWVKIQSRSTALIAKEDFTHGIKLSVNHGGDSDSTGAITGNIFGALLGWTTFLSSGWTSWNSGRSWNG
ncbi:MAG: ADP-ribosylglycohydrolase family protein [Geobacter sp.]|nr:MAG: ADP-ribosylglycohydrolase family protein [Geobacter sp.]